jgi:hypothetical protein
MATHESLILNQQRDITKFRDLITSAANKPDGRRLIADLDHRIAMAERAISIIRADQARRGEIHH